MAGNEVDRASNLRLGGGLTCQCISTPGSSIEEEIERDDKRVVIDQDVRIYRDLYKQDI